MSNKEISYKRKIFGFECDIYGHLNNACYLHLYEEARAEAMDKAGCSVKDFNDNDIAVYITQINIDFKKELPLGEEVEIVSSIVGANKLRLNWTQKIFNSNKELCNKAEVNCVFVKNGKPFRISDDMLNKIQEN